MAMARQSLEKEAPVESDAVGGSNWKLRGEIHETCQKTVEMLKLTWEGFRRQDTRPFEPAAKLGREIHQREKTLTEFVVGRLAGQADASVPNQEFVFLPMHLERIGDNIEFLIRAIGAMVQEGIPFSERAMREVNALFEKAVELVECVRDAIGTKNQVLIRHIIEEGRRYEQMANDYALVHQERLIEGVCLPRASSVYLAILDYLKGIESHTRQMAQKLSGVSIS